MSETTEPSPASDLILYQTEDGKTRIQCRFEDESLWLTQAQIADLFQTTPQNITQHIKAIYEGGELSEDSTCKPLLQVRSEGGRQFRRQLSLQLACHSCGGFSRAHLLASKVNDASKHRWELV